MLDELERVRAYRDGVPEPDEVIVEAARAQLVKAMRAEPRGTARPAGQGARLRKAQRRRRFALAGGIAAAGLAVAGVLGLHTAANPQPALAATMDRLAHLAASQDWSGMPGPGQYLYTKSEGAYISDSGELRVDHRESWFPSSGRILLWDPPVNHSDKVASLGGGPNTYFPTTASGWQALSTDPATLLQQIHKLDAPNAPNTPAEWFENVNDALIDGPIPQASREALYRAVALIPGVTLLGSQTDPLGRTGLGVEYKVSGPTDPSIPTTKLIFDQQTGGLLAEEEFNLDGKLTGSWSYLEQKVVDSAPAAGSAVPSTNWPPVDTSDLAAPTHYVGPTVTVRTTASGTSTTITSSSPTPVQTTTTPAQPITNP